jgi:DNA replication protein DnaC
VVAPNENAPASARTVIPCQCQERVWGVKSSDRIRQYSDLGPLERLTFDTVELGTRDTYSEPSSFRDAYHAAQRFVSDMQGWLVLCGPSGTGKTHLAAAVGNALVNDGHPVRFVSVPDLLDHLRSAFDPAVGAQYDEIFLQAIEAPILILDDLGAQSSTAWADEKLDQILTHRYNRRLPTLVTTGVPFEELGDRLRTRLGDPYFSTVVRIKAGSGLPDIRDSGLGSRLSESMTFDSFTKGAAGATAAQRRSLSEAHAAAKVFAEHPSGWLYLAGPTGVGKTHLAAAIVSETIAQGREVLFRFVPDLLDDLRRSYGPAGGKSFDNIFSQVRDVDVLVLDDFGAEASTAWAEEKLYQLIVRRHDAMMPTVFTSRTALETIGGQPDSRAGSRYSDAIISRLSDANVVAERYLSAPDYRHRGATPRPRSAGSGGSGRKSSRK